MLSLQNIAFTQTTRVVDLAIFYVLLMHDFFIRWIFHSEGLPKELVT